MTMTQKVGVWTAAMLAAVILLVAGASQASAQSEVTGTLTSGTAATGSTATGTVSGGTGNTISGTVVSGTPQCSDGIDNDGDGEIDLDDPACDLPSYDDESDDPGSARNSNRSSNNDDDDDGEVLGADTSSGVGGAGDVLVPGVPNTGLGGDSGATMALLLGSLAVFAAGATAWRRYSL